MSLCACGRQAKFLSISLIKPRLQNMQQVKLLLHETENTYSHLTKELSVPQQVVPSLFLLLLLFFIYFIIFFLAMMAHQVWGDAGGYYTIKSG
jgi:hypothetical protein